MDTDAYTNLWSKKEQGEDMLAIDHISVMSQAATEKSGLREMRARFRPFNNPRTHLSHSRSRRNMTGKMTGNRCRWDLNSKDLKLSVLKAPEGCDPHPHPQDP